MDQNCDSNGAYHQLAEYETENPPSASFQSFEGLRPSMEQAPWSIEVVPTLSLQETDEGSSSSRRRRHAADFPGRTSTPPSHIRYRCLEHASRATRRAHFPAPLASGGSLAAPQEAYVPIDHPEYFGALSGTCVQAFQAQMPYASEVGLPYDLGNELVQARELQDQAHNTIRGPFGSNEDIGWFIDVPGPIIAVNPRGVSANTPFNHSNATAQGGWENISDVPVPNGSRTSTLPLRPRGSRLPPRPYESDAERLYNRLIAEGADIGTAMILCFLIFADGVTIDALMAPIKTPEIVRAFDGATKMWGLLLETKEAVGGKKKYCCLLCPPENRREYGHNRDAVRHFNKDHFGFSFPCDYW